MSIYIKAFLETEITPIPQMMDHYIGKYYNNALYNGITWMIFILHIIHFVFDVSVNGLLRKMRFKEYIRIRLKKSVWYLGFYSCSFLYCLATLWKNNIKLPHRHKFQILDLTEPISGHLILGYVMLSAFYASSSMWEGLQCSISSFTYLFLTGFVAFTYFLRYIELAILLASTFSIIHIVTELTRCLFCIIKGDMGLLKLLVHFIFCISIIMFAVTYFVVIPVSFVLPVAQGFLKNPNSVIMAGLNISLWGWLLCEIYSSPLYRLIQHRWYHHSEADNKVPECLGSKVECALFLPRDDVAYNLKVMRQEIKERQARMMALRKPKKGASMLVQTLKCVAAINRKIKYRKLLDKTHSENPIQQDCGAIVKELEDEVFQSSINLEEENDVRLVGSNISSDISKSENDVANDAIWKMRNDLKGIVEEDKEELVDDNNVGEQSVQSAGDNVEEN